MSHKRAFVQFGHLKLGSHFRRGSAAGAAGIWRKTNQPGIHMDRSLFSNTLAGPANCIRINGRIEKPGVLFYQTLVAPLDEADVEQEFERK